MGPKKEDFDYLQAMLIANIAAIVVAIATAIILSFNMRVQRTYRPRQPRQSAFS